MDEGEKEEVFKNSKKKMRLSDVEERLGGGLEEEIRRLLREELGGDQKRNKGSRGLERAV